MKYAIFEYIVFLYSDLKFHNKKWKKIPLVFYRQNAVECNPQRRKCHQASEAAVPERRKHREASTNAALELGYED